MVRVGSTVRIRNRVFDFDGITILEPDTQEVKIYDSTGILKKTIENDDVKTESPGIYYIDYTITGTPDGKWKAVWKVVKGDISDVEVITFIVSDA